MNSLKSFWKAITIYSLINLLIIGTIRPFTINLFFGNTTSHFNVIIYDSFQLAIRISASLLVLLVFCKTNKANTKDWLYLFYKIALIFGGIILPLTLFWISGEIKSSFIIQLVLLFLIIFFTGHYFKIIKLKYFSSIWIIIGILLFTYSTALEFFSSILSQMTVPFIVYKLTSYLQSFLFNIYPLIALICTSYYILRKKEEDNI